MTSFVQRTVPAAPSFSLCLLKARTSPNRTLTSAVRPSSSPGSAARVRDSKGDGVHFRAEHFVAAGRPRD
jgi:hypothetical protein